jgi:hypothetical protein
MEARLIKKRVPMADRSQALRQNQALTDNLGLLAPDTRAAHPQRRSNVIIRPQEKARKAKGMAPQITPGRAQAARMTPFQCLPGRKARLHLSKVQERPLGLPKDRVALGALQDQVVSNSASNFNHYYELIDRSSLQTCRP